MLYSLARTHVVTVDRHIFSIIKFQPSQGTIVSSPEEHLAAGTDQEINLHEVAKKTCAHSICGNRVRLFGLLPELAVGIPFARALRLLIQIQRIRGDGGLSDFNEVTIRITHVAPQLRWMDFRLSDEFRAPRRPKIVAVFDIRHAKVEKDA